MHHAQNSFYVKKKKEKQLILKNTHQFSMFIPILYVCHFGRFKMPENQSSEGPKWHMSTGKKREKKKMMVKPWVGKRADISHVYGKGWVGNGIHRTDLCTGGNS